MGLLEEEGKGMEGKVRLCRGKSERILAYAWLL